MHFHESAVDQRRRIRAALRSSLPTSYFTLISLIQGTALGFLGATVKDGARVFGSEQWLAALATFLIVVQVWNEYRISVTLWSGVPVLQDSVVPFTLGALEFWLVFSIPLPALWLVALGFFSLGGVIAYIHVRRLQDLPENQEAAIHRPYMQAQLWWTLAYAFLFFALSTTYRIEVLATFRTVTFVCVVGLVCLLLIRSELHWRRVLRLVETWD